jgi:hypothetical protein
MADRPMKTPWSDHPISIEANPSRVFGSYLVGYLSMAALALVLGVIATARGLGLAVDLGAAAIAMVSE